MYRGSYTIVGIELSMFTRKLEAQLCYQQIPHGWQFKTAEAGPNWEARAGTRFVPLLETPDGWVINDTIAIGPLLNDRFSECSVLPVTPVQRAASFVLEDYFNHWFPRHALHTRWIDHDNAMAAGRCFGANMLLNKSIDEPLSDEEQATVADMGNFMRDSFGLAACDVQGAGADQQEAVEGDFHQMMGILKTLLEAQPFLLGDTACLADFALVGPIKAHFLQDPLPLSWLEKNGNRAVLEAYVERVYAGAQPGAVYAANDTLAPSLQPLLDHMVANYQPFARASIVAAQRGEKTFTLDVGRGEFTARSMKRLEKARQHVRDELSGLSLAGSMLEKSGALGLYAPESL
ncbi:MAG: glutathione S-transferase family protein [Halioglobus sp.]